MPTARSAEILGKLQTDILRLQGFKSTCDNYVNLGLGAMTHSFPNGNFPLAAVHEFLATDKESQAATSGFIAGLLSTLMGDRGTVLWVSSSRTLFPPALRAFNIQPDKFIFVDLKNEKLALWAIEEALKCSVVTCVVGEITELSFIASRRLQLAVERNQVTGFVIRQSKKKPDTTACVSRWRILPLYTEPIDNLPGIGFPRWKVELLRMRNGTPGKWDIQWLNGRFVPSAESPEANPDVHLYPLKRGSTEEPKRIAG